MSKEIKMPQLSDTMDKGKILTWHKKEGDTIERGDVLAEVETDKANLEIESFDSGTLLKIVTQANEMADVGEIIAVIGEAGEEVTVSSQSSSSETASSSAEVVETKSADVSVDVPKPKTTTANIAPAVANQSLASSSNGRIKASPIAKKLAKSLNVDLTLIQGSGPAGRILKKDIETFSVGGGAEISSGMSAGVSGTMAQVKSISPAPVIPMTKSTPRPVTSPVNIPEGTSELSKMRATIASRMEMATSTPHFYTTVSIDMTEAVKLRSTFKSNPSYSSISINHMIIKAAGYALTQAPMVNCAYRDNQLYNPGSFNIGVITTVEGGLLIPVVKDVDKKHILDVATETRGLVDRAREKKPKPDDLTGGTFGISNMGMFDVENFTAIINPGQGAVLAVSSTRDEVVAVDGTMAIRPKMKVTLSVDHRIIDGVVAGNFLAAFKAAMESPALMMM